MLAKKPVADLVRCGILMRLSTGIVPGPGVTLQDLELFAPLIDRYQPDMRPLPSRGAPLHFCTAIAPGGAGTSAGTGKFRPAIAAGGQSETPAQAALGCLGELAERLGFFCEDGGDARIGEVRAGLPDLAAGPFLGFSPDQERALVGKQRVLDPVWDGRSIHWNALSTRRVRVRNLVDNREGQLPSLAVLFGEGAREGLRIPGLASTIGSAVWRTREGAVERAVYELVERDAFARVWYNRLGITAIPKRFYPQILPEKICLHLEQRHRQTRIFRVLTDLPVHVVSAISAAPDGYWGALGVSASGDFREAASGAVREMYQTELMTALSARKIDGNEAEHSASPVLEYARQTRIFDDLKIGGVPEDDGVQLGQVHSYQCLIDACAAKGIDLWACDLTRSDLRIPTVKVLSGALCTWQPRFGKSRLFDVCVDLGLTGKAPSEAQLAQRPPFPF
ncbi:YcaO-like family protein [Roseibium sp. RKSG952]|uniref:YcaO-like family protein n=1 Tax=Roseibium sp. RKSG952 TaxID=2529384 RepID=UPI0018AD0EBB|nr:YcaO-like family protein [Roseibium sp. RKSG952]